MSSYILYEWSTEDEGGLAICFPEHFENAGGKIHREKIIESSSVTELAVAMMEYSDDSKDLDYYLESINSMIENLLDRQRFINCDSDKIKRYDKIVSMLKNYNIESSCLENDYMILKDIMSIINDN